MERLRTLVLSGNDVRGIALSVTLHSLNGAAVQRLRLADNGILRLGGSLLWPASLRRLDLSDNSIATLKPRGFVALSRLETLSLAGNRLSRLQGGTFASLASLRRLDLDNNYLQRFAGETFAGLGSLVYLGLDGNRLKEVESSWFRPLVALRVLSLSANRLRVLAAGALSSLPVVELRVRRTPTLEAVEAGSLTGLFALKSLSLSDNANLVFFSDDAVSVTSTSKLRRLDFADNALTSLPVDLYALAASAESLTLTGNPFRCDCTAEWIEKALAAPKSNSVRRQLADLKCSRPASARGASLAAPLADKRCRPRTLVYPRESTVRLGERETFTCRVLGPHRRSGVGGGQRWRLPSGAWLNGTRSNDARYSLNGVRLTVRTARLVDRGRYECHVGVAEAEVGVAEVEVGVVGVGVLHVVGGDLKLRWTARTAHSLAVTWYREEPGVGQRAGQGVGQRVGQGRRRSALDRMGYSIQYSEIGSRVQRTINKLSRIG